MVFPLIRVRGLSPVQVLYLLAVPVVIYIGLSSARLLVADPDKTTILAFMAIASALIFAKPLYGVYLIAVEEFCLVPFAIYGRSIGLIIVVLTALATVLRTKFEALPLIRQLKGLFRYMLLLFFLVALSLAIHGHFFSHAKIAFNILFFILVISLMYIHLTTKERLWTFLKVALVCAFISASLGVVQFLFRPAFLFMHVVDRYVDNPVFALRAKERLRRSVRYSIQGRVMGLNRDSISYSKDIAVVAVVVSAFVVLGGGRRFLLKVLAFVIWLGLAFSFNRAAIGGTFLGLLYVLHRHRGIRKGKLWIPLMLLVLSMPFWHLFLERSLGVLKVSTLKDDSVYSRVGAYYNAIMLGIRYPLFGTGPTGSASTEDMKGIGSFISHASGHNRFLMTWYRYGFPALIVLILIYREIIRYCRFVAHNAKDRDLYILGNGLLASMIGDILFSFFHPYGWEYLILWLITGTIVVAHRFTTTELAQRNTPQAS